MPTTLVNPELPAAGVIRALIDSGLEADTSRRVQLTVLDSFDGRLEEAGLRLELHSGDGIELVMSDRQPDGSPAAHLGVAAPPRTVGELPVGPFRSRVAAALEDRALLPLMTVDAKRTRLIQRDRRHKATVTVDVYSSCAVPGDGAVALPGTVAEITESPGHRGDRDAVGATLESIGMTLGEGDLLTLAAAAAGVDLRGRRTSPTVPLDPHEPAIEGLRRVLRNLADTVEINQPGAVDALDPEFLHELRVAVRRTRSLLSRGRGILPDVVRDQFRDEFGWLGERTGPARDLDVYLLEWDTYVEPLPTGAADTLRPVLREIEGRRQAAYEQLARDLRSKRYTALMSDWYRWLDHDASPGPVGTDPLGPLVVQRITKAQRRLVSDGRKITPSSPPPQLHDLRKDAKKLRYLIECFGSLFDAKPRKRFVQRLKALQDNLGEHQDAEVHVSQLRELANDLHATSAVDADALLATGQLTEHLEARRRAARAAFVDRFSAYDTKATERALDDLVRTALR